MYTLLPSKKSKCGCRCEVCARQFSFILLAESLLSPSSVPGGVRSPTKAIGFFSLTMTQKPEFFIHVAVQNLKNITMSHLHFYNKEKPKENGPILIWLTDTMKKPATILDGVLVSRTFTTSDFAAPYKNMPLEDFRSLIMERRLYFNAHTTQNPNGELAAPVQVIKKFE